jgi:hypothetical protein
MGAGAGNTHLVEIFMKCGSLVSEYIYIGVRRGHMQMLTLKGFTMLEASVACAMKSGLNARLAVNGNEKKYLEELELVRVHIYSFGCEGVNTFYMDLGFDYHDPKKPESRPISVREYFEYDTTTLIARMTPKRDRR